MAKLNGFTKLLTKGKVFFQKNSPIILVTTGVGLMVTGAVVACKETMKVEEIIDTHLEYKEKIEALVADKTEIHTDDGEIVVCDEEYGKVNKRKHTAYTIFRLVKNYAPAALLLIAGALCIFKGFNILNGRFTTVSAALATSSAKFADYRQYIRENAENGEQLDRDAISGKKLEQKITEAIDENGNITTKVDDILSYAPNSDTAVLFDETVQRWNRNGAINQSTLATALNNAMLKLNSRGYLFVYEIVEALGIERQPSHQNKGWMTDRYNKNFPYCNNQIKIFANGVDIMSEGFDMYRDDNQGWWIDFNCAPEPITPYL